MKQKKNWLYLLISIVVVGGITFNDHLAAATSPAVKEWVCSYCTYEKNSQAVAECEVCGTARPAPVKIPSSGGHVVVKPVQPTVTVPVKPPVQPHLEPAVQSAAPAGAQSVAPFAPPARVPFTGSSSVPLKTQQVNYKTAGGVGLVSGAAAATLISFLIIKLKINSLKKKQDALAQQGEVDQALDLRIDRLQSSMRTHLIKAVLFGGLVGAGGTLLAHHVRNKTK